VIAQASIAILHHSRRARYERRVRADQPAHARYGARTYDPATSVSAHRKECLVARRRTVPDPSTETIRVVMVEPQPVLGAGVREVLDRESGIEVVAQVSSPDEALPIVGDMAPNVILVDVPEPESAAATGARRLHRETPRSAMVVLGGQDDDASIVGAVEIGAAGHVAGLAKPMELVSTIRRAAGGEDPIKAELSARPDLVGRIVDRVRTTILEDDGLPSPITPRELEILGLVADGLRNRQIATRLDVSLQTVKNHLSTVLHKLGVRNRTRAVTYAVRQGWLPYARVPGRTASSATSGHPDGSSTRDRQLIESGSPERE
jgi:two-component system response regulator DegU